MAYLHREGPFAGVPQPRLVLLDLNLPRKDGREVLEEMKSDPALCSIPVLILSTSKTREDVRLAYMLHANGYITKPVDFSAWPALIRSIWDFWFNVVELPNGAVPLGT
jgi:CheY-like chemotaxis protein